MKKNTLLYSKNTGLFLLGSISLLATMQPIHAAAANTRHLNVPHATTCKEKLPKAVILNAFGSFSIDLEQYQLTPAYLEQQLNDWLSLNPKHTFEKIKDHIDDLGIAHQSYQHLYNGYKIDGELLLIHSKDNVVQFVNGQISQFTDLNTMTNITDEQALGIAKAQFKGNNIHVESMATVISKIPSNATTKLVLVKKITLSSLKPINGETYFIDIQSGAIINQYKTIKHTNAPGVGATFYRGTQNINVDSYNNQYRLKDNIRNIHTLNGTNLDISVSGTSLIGAIEYTIATTTFSNISMRPAIDVHWGIAKAYDYYKEIHNRNSYDGNGSIILNYYNAGNFMDDDSNAAAIDQQGIVGIVYGKGDGDYMNPVVGLDVAGHEYSHLVISRSNNGSLTYQGESGALNESFADMFGTAIEFYTNLSPNWTLGENVLIVAPGYMRSMSDPKSASEELEAQQPNTYKGEYWVDTETWIDNGGVHINSGVSNYWFYLLSMGGSGTNDINKQYNVTGIGIKKAEKIAYRTLNLLTPDAQFIDAYNASKIAATNMYGANSNELKQVVEAWWAVGIGDRSLGIDENEFNRKLAVYPNPTVDKNFNIDTSFTQSTTVEIYDILGKKVRNAIVLEKGQNQINVSELQTGIYILKFNTGGQSFSKKLMIH